jgi:transcription elongation GreA/GreB family factor
VIPDAVDVEEGHISVSSPLGQALLDKKVKSVTKVHLPFGTRRLKIKKLVTMHDLASASDAE